MSSISEILEDLRPQIEKSSKKAASALSGSKITVVDGAYIDLDCDFCERAYASIVTSMLESGASIGFQHNLSVCMLIKNPETREVVFKFGVCF